MKPISRLVCGSLLLLAGCKGNLSDEWRVDEERKDDAFLGVVVAHAPDPGNADPRGIVLLRVLRDSPADDAGVRPGDVLVRFGATPIRVAADLEAALTGPPTASLDATDDLREEQLGAALRDLEEAVDDLVSDGSRSKTVHAGPERLNPNSRIELTVLRGEEELLIPVSLRPWGEYRTMADERLDEAAAAHEVEVTIPFLFDYSRREIPPETWLAWRGRRVTGPVVTYEDIDLLPAIVASLFRREELPLSGTTRVTIVHWPLRFTVDGESEVYDELLGAGEDALEVH